MAHSPFSGEERRSVSSWVDIAGHPWREVQRDTADCKLVYGKMSTCEDIAGVLIEDIVTLIGAAVIPSRMPGQSHRTEPLVGRPMATRGASAFTACMFMKNWMYSISHGCFGSLPVYSRAEVASGELG